MFAQALQPAEQPFMVRHLQALIVEELRGCENDRAVNVKLLLLKRLVADSDRSHTPIAAQRWGGDFSQLRIPADAVERLQFRRRSARMGVVDKVQILLHGLRGAQPVQSVYRVIAVT